MAANQNAQSGLEKEQIFGMAEKEMEYRVELFNKNFLFLIPITPKISVIEISLGGLPTRVLTSALTKSRYKESELNMGENSCIDRCVSKYWHVTNLVGQLLGSGRPGM
ncbi:hypothetical protein TIFTF001_000333 [Ficus carica]|uniref:Mitochondrial import inner membrane translocase subunit n=1 Tax=Ficus carica TaxID=3494 RepID=A0AA88CMX8_FICCA|nr:hypothetical protein TIFTF001_000333 [Ficus carica]